MVSHLFGGGTPTGELVLILIVMDNGLSRTDCVAPATGHPVLILIVMDNGLSRFTMPVVGAKAKS